ncbi:MAG TPA: hypothetical protein VFQ45_05460 [Longimicrobium sp.]|nr:hypothetical protein [Longimicrobium sp.]
MARTPFGHLLLLPLAALAACGRSEAAEPPPLSGAEVYNREMTARAATARPVLREPEAAFTGAFRLVGRAALAVPGEPGSAVLPTVCAMDGPGTVYLATRRRPHLYRWRTDGAAVERLPVPASARPDDPTALAFGGAPAGLHVLDMGGQRLLRYAPDGAPRGYTYLNAGQTGFAMALAPGGGAVVGGERWESHTAATLLAAYDSVGRLTRAFLPMDPGVIARHEHVHVPVAIAADEDGTLLAAEPTWYTVRRLSPDGAELARLGRAPPGYLPPHPRAEGATLAETEQWLASWTPLLFVHGGGGLVFSGFEVRRPYRGFQLDVYARDGRRLAAGLRSDARPACGAGRTLVFTRRSGPNTVELSAWEYAGPGAEAGR